MGSEQLNIDAVDATSVGKSEYMTSTMTAMKRRFGSKPPPLRTAPVWLTAPLETALAARQRRRSSSVVAERQHGHATTIACGIPFGGES